MMHYGVPDARKARNSSGKKLGQETKTFTGHQMMRIRTFALCVFYIKIKCVYVFLNDILIQLFFSLNVQLTARIISD